MNAPDRFLTWRWENEEEEERERLKYQSDSKKPNAGDRYSHIQSISIFRVLLNE